MKLIKITKGFYVKVDDKNFEWLSKYKWHIQISGNQKYAMHNRIGKMHRYILGLVDSNIHTDHIDSNGLNNQRSNLRVVTMLKICLIEKVYIIHLLNI